MSHQSENNGQNKYPLCLKKFYLSNSLGTSKKEILGSNQYIFLEVGNIKCCKPSFDIYSVAGL